MSPADDLTGFLRRASATHDPDLESRVFTLVQDQLKVLAHSLLRGHDGDATLQPTLLVDEAFVRLIRGGTVDWENRSSFFRLAHGTMKRILSTHRRRRRPLRTETDAAGLIEDRTSSPPSQAMEEEEQLRAMSGALQDFLDRGDPNLVNTFLLSFFHRVGKAAGLRAEDLIAEFTGDRTPFRRSGRCAGLFDCDGVAEARRGVDVPSERPAHARRRWRRVTKTGAGIVVPAPPIRRAAALAQLDRHRLRLGVVLQRRLAVLAALAGHLEAAERRRRVHDVVAVHPHRPRLHLLGEQVRLVDVLRPDGGGQAVGRLVGPLRSPRPRT